MKFKKLTFYAEIPLHLFKKGSKLLTCNEFDIVFSKTNGQHTHKIEYRDLHVNIYYAVSLTNATN